MSGHLFVSSIATALVANIFYKPSLGNFVRELINTPFVVVPVPEEFKGRTFSELVEHIMRKSNLLPMALLRRKDTSDLDLEQEDEAGHDPEVLKIFQQEVIPRWHLGEQPADRYAKLMPFGDSRVVEHDGVLCAVAMTGRVVIPPMGRMSYGMVHEGPPTKQHKP
mmetsp:Transcript_108950/g.336439  ORF Transcript_108950/g.336439 Transcript_108950/m.336439 type:complete len:165 (-) Transcript_108950:13-507(-)